jgi:hypothetical protein
LPEFNGVWLARGNSWAFAQSGKGGISTQLSAEELAQRSDAMSQAGESTWASSVRHIFNGSAPGCTERRTRQHAPMAYLGQCEFDGRLSMVRFRGQLRLFARANPAVHGERFVQTVSSSDGGVTWGRFSLVTIEEYDHAQGDIYFFAGERMPPSPRGGFAFY